MTFMETIKLGLAISGYFIVVASLSVITQDKVFRLCRKLTEDQLLSPKFMALQLTTGTDLQ